MSLHTVTSIQVNNQEIGLFEALEVHQRIDGHHEFEIRINQEGFSGNGSGQFSQVKDFLGKEIAIEIRSLVSSSAFKPFRFKGLVSSVGTGKPRGNMHGQCVLRGFSPTILMEDDLHVHAYEQQRLGGIVQDVVRNYPANLLKPAVAPKNGENQKYIVQYNENSYEFLNRLSGRFGEWFFYDGEALVFGSYEPATTELTHDIDLIDFELEVKLRPANVRFTTYEYRNDTTVEGATRSQEVKASNPYSKHALETSDSLYTREALFKVNYGFSSAASSQIKTLASQHRKSRVGEMVTMKGNSRNPSVRIGDIIKIGEQLFNQEDFGDFVVTRVSHFCNEEGNYRNSFTAVPADAACPCFDLSRRPEAEPQSAVVVANNDPKGLGRVRVRFHWQQQGMTPWIRIISAAGGGDKGFYMIPEIGEEVFVDFEGGNPECPFVQGTTYNGSAKSSFGNAGNDVKALKTRSGSMVKMDDSNGSILMTDPSGSNVNLGGDGTMSMTDANGNHVKMDGSGKIHITASDSLVFNAKNIELNATENCTVAKDKMVIDVKGNKINHTADEINQKAGKGVIDMGDTAIKGRIKMN